MAMNLASKYSQKVDERFYRDSQAMMALSNEYEFTGVKTVNVYSVPVVAMTDYGRTGAARYGTPGELQNSIQSLTLTKDRSFTFTIDKGNKIQSQMVMDAGKALARQLREVVVPEFDTYVFGTLATAAVANSKAAYDAVTKSNAYQVFLAGQESLGDDNVPDSGRVAFCSYKFANFLKQDSAFMKYSNMSQEMIIKGVLGEVDGTKIVKVPKGRLPEGCSFILTHPIAAVGPKQLEDYKIHDNPPGISGWLIEGRIIYDSFVLDSKKNAVYFHEGEGTLGTLTVASVAGSGSTNDTKLSVTEDLQFTEHKFVYKLGTSATAVKYGDDLSAWTELTEGANIAASTNTLGQVAEVTAGGLAIKVGEVTLVKKS